MPPRFHYLRSNRTLSVKSPRDDPELCSTCRPSKSRQRRCLRRRVRPHQPCRGRSRGKGVWGLLGCVRLEGAEALDLAWNDEFAVIAERNSVFGGEAVGSFSPAVDLRALA